VPSPGLPTEEGERECDAGDGEQVRVLAPADDSHDGGGSEDRGQGDEVDPSGGRVPAWALLGAGG
jgi:hypothetical protein